VVFLFGVVVLVGGFFVFGGVFLRVLGTSLFFEECWGALLVFIYFVFIFRFFGFGEGVV